MYIYISEITDMYIYIYIYMDIVAVCCSEVLCVAGRCSVLQCVAVCFSL